MNKAMNKRVREVSRPEGRERGKMIDGDNDEGNGEE